MFVFLPLGLQNLKNTFIQWPIRGFYRGGVIYLNRISLLENDTWQCRSLGHPPFHKNLCGQFLLEFSARKIFYRSGLICKLSKKKNTKNPPPFCSPTAWIRTLFSCSPGVSRELWASHCLFDCYQRWTSLPSLSFRLSVSCGFNALMFFLEVFSEVGRYRNWK